jgi:enoyl-CoA hydratase
VAYEDLLVDRQDAVAIVTINRPRTLNALTYAAMAEIASVTEELGADPAVRAVVFTGAGDRAFVAGADINEVRAIASPEEGERKMRYGQGVFMGIERLPKPVVMAINGFALGAGLELAMAGDVRIAADSAKLGLPEINLGVFPGWGGTQRLPRLVGKGAGKLLVLTGEMVSAQEALRLGLVDRVVPAAELLPSALALAQMLAAKAPVALALALQAVNEGLEMDIDEGMALEARLWGQVTLTEDKAEGTAAFLEKRKAIFKGR